MYQVKTPLLFRFFNPQYLNFRMPAGEKQVFLTFDDGPVPEATPEVLEILSSKQVKATFFCVGENVKKHSEVFNQVVTAGHRIGNHSFSHLNGWKTPPALYAENVDRCREYFETSLFHPPYGRFTPSQYFLLRKNYRFIMWSVLSGDFDSHTSADQCLKQVLDNVSDGSIIVFHDSIKTISKIRQILPLVIDGIRSRGLDFAVL